MEEKLNKLLARIFNIPVESINSNLSMENVPTWDSLAHVNLIYELEETFGVTFQPHEAINLINYASIQELLKKKTPALN